MSEFIEASDLWLPGLAAMLSLILVSAFFSSSETALFYLSHDELRRLRVGKPRERAAAFLLSDPDRLLTAILFWNLFVNLCYFAVSVVVAQRLIRADLNVAAGCFGAMSLVGMILFGEVLPKSIAVTFRHGLSSLVSWPLAFAVRFLDPVTRVLTGIAVLARRAFWPHLDRETFLQAEDLERAVEVSFGSQEVVGEERHVLHNILDLSEIPVEEAMRPRGTYVALPPPVALADLGGKVPPSDYVMIRQPLRERITGAVPICSLSSIPTEGLEKAAEEVVHVPWCSSLAYTLQLLRDRFCSVAEVVNEYGETVGIVTYEDIVDTIVVPHPSRARRLLRRDPVVELPGGSYQIEGITTLRYLCRRLGIDYEADSDRLVTVAGLLHEELEHVPVVGDECEWRGHRIKVVDIPKPGQLRATLTRIN